MYGDMVVLIDCLIPLDSGLKKSQERVNMNEVLVPASSVVSDLLFGFIFHILL